MTQMNHMNFILMATGMKHFGRVGAFYTPFIAREMLKHILNMGDQCLDFLEEMSGLLLSYMLRDQGSFPIKEQFNLTGVNY
jgi:hypothetical protein